jgi:hypothetical protein
MKIQNIILPCLFVFATACGPAQQQQIPVGNGKYKADVYQKANQRCPTGRTLQEDSNATNVSIQDVGPVGTIIGLSKDGGTCFGSHNINVPNRGIFNVTVNGGCAENDSLWIISESKSVNNNYYTYTLSSLDNQARGTISILASQGISATVARDDIGFRVLTCQ